MILNVNMPTTHYDIHMLHEKKTSLRTENLVSLRLKHLHIKRNKGIEIVFITYPNFCPNLQVFEFISVIAIINHLMPINTASTGKSWFYVGKKEDGV